VGFHDHILLRVLVLVLVVEGGRTAPSRAAAFDVARPIRRDTILGQRSVRRDNPAPG
jgi:hypothetical protein